MKTIKEAAEAKKQMEEKIRDIMTEFEKEYGMDTIKDVRLKRYNGSNSVWGRIVEVSVGVSLI